MRRFNGSKTGALAISGYQLLTAVYIYGRYARQHRRSIWKEGGSLGYYSFVGI